MKTVQSRGGFRLMSPGSGRATAFWLLAFGLIGVAGVHAFEDRAGEAQLVPWHGVRVIIDYADGVEKHFNRIEWKNGMTVMDAMNAAKASTHGITFAHSGSGETAFVTQIDDLKNEGGKGRQRNWTYRVNDKLVDKGAGSYELKEKDVVRWVYSSKGLVRH